MKRVILTGGSEGLGKEVGLLCVENNIEVICISRGKPSYPAIHLKADLAEESEVKKIALVIKEKYGDFDALIHCAGIILLDNPESVSYQKLEKVLKVNTFAPIFLTSQLFPLIKKNGADILNVGSTVGMKAKTNQVAYGVSKWGMRGFSENLRLELKDAESRIIQFSPGGFKSNHFQKATGKKADLSPYMDPKYLAQTILFILQLPKQVEISEILISRK